MAKQREVVLLYNFSDEIAGMVKECLSPMRIETRLLPRGSHSQTIGALLGGKNPPAPDDGEFDFPHEVMVLDGIKGKRLDKVLAAMNEAGVPKVRYKAVVTPFNTLWTLKRLCLTMRKEHAALAEMEAQK